MADKPKKPDATAPAEPPPPAKKKLPIKTIAVVAIIMGLEAGAVVTVMSMLGPKESHASTDADQLIHDDSDQTGEIELVADQFQNLQTGQVWVWDLAVVLQVKNKHAEAVQGVLEQRAAEIKEGISQIINRAQHSQLKEPERQTLQRQIASFLERVRGLTDDDKKPLFERVMIPKCRGYPADS